MRRGLSGSIRNQCAEATGGDDLASSFLAGCRERAAVFFRVIVRSIRPAFVGFTACCACWLPAGAEASPNEHGRPNILVIVADDLGYSEISPFGGEIDTPNLASLAREGIILTHMYAAPVCSPSRAMLLSGVDPHRVGLGNMAETVAPNQIGRTGYEGYLNFNVATLAEVLQDADYETFMAGKWHLGWTERTMPGARGFDRSFVLLDGAAGHLSDLAHIPSEPPRYRQDDRPIDLPEDFYSTRTYTDKLIEFLDSNRSADSRFFAYLAYTAPHYPLQAPRSSIKKQAGVYDIGYEVIRSRRLARMKALGLVEPEVSATPRPGNVLEWNELSPEEQRLQARKMEVFAAMVTDMDDQIGRLLDYLRRTGRYENTLIFFVSDNGAEGHELDAGWDELGDWVAECCNNSLDNIGNADSYVWYGPGWGWAGSTPFRLYKGFVSEGGIRVPAILRLPGGRQGNLVNATPFSLMDVMPTVLDIAGVEHPVAKTRDRPLYAMQGQSMLASLSDSIATRASGRVFGWELFGRRAIQSGDWKILYQDPPYGMGRWQLFNLVRDPAETSDYSTTDTERLQQLQRLWRDYAESNGVIIPNWTPPGY